jgi:hypothetical protein
MRTGILPLMPPSKGAECNDQFLDRRTSELDGFQPQITAHKKQLKGYKSFISKVLLIIHCYCVLFFVIYHRRNITKAHIHYSLHCKDNVPTMHFLWE